MIGITMATRGWILLAPCLEACLDRLVLPSLFCVIWRSYEFFLRLCLCFYHLLKKITLKYLAAIQEVNQGCQRLCAEG